MDLGEQTQRVKFMIRDRGSNFTTAFDAVLAGAGIRTVLCNVRTPRMNAIAERWIGGYRREGSVSPTVFPAVGLVGLGGREPVAEGDGKSVERGLPSHRPPGAAGPGRVQGPGDQVKAL
jgi:transposase InsO family protein